MRVRRSAWAVAILLSALAMLGCQALLDFEPDLRPEPDGGAALDAGTASAGSGNLVVNGDFSGGCAEWRTNGSRAEPSTDGRDGRPFACLVCADKGTSVYTLAQIVDSERLRAGAIYQAEAWVRAAPNHEKATAMYIGAAAVDGDANEKPGPDLDDAWRPMKVEHTYQRVGSDLRVEILNRNTDDGCFLVDDVTLTAIR
jgi:hypothetical protein